MSQSIRQSNLFSSEDFTKIYQSFKNVDFQAYDFDTIKSALITYIKEQFPEDFNDYIESSEFIAVVELLAYLGTSLAFRTDLNSRENFMDTAERRESIIRLARMVNYQPKRNIPAEGLFKLTGISTTEQTTDSLGVDLTGQTIYWNDVNNSSSYEQIITILNKALSSSNTFGKPFKKGTIGGIKTHLYRLNSVPFTNITYPTSVDAEGVSYPVDIVNTDFNDGESFFERHPNPENAMHLVYRNDTNGLDSADTGFFLHFKQGTLSNHDYVYDFPLENRVEEIDASNVNNSDVYVQKVQDTGAVLEEWTQVPSIAGNNIAYNSIALDTKTVFSVISGFDDTVSIKYSDGNFGDVPKDSMRVWTRTSANKNIVFRPDDVVNRSISIPYTGNDDREYTLTLLFSLETTVANRALSETNDEIKENAPQVFYTQDRMVNNEDYNVFPLTRGNEIAKLRAVNRTHSGHSRYIDINDPTGQHSDIILFAEDGAIYKEPDDFTASEEITDTVTTDEIVSTIQAQLENVKLRNFFYDAYLADYKLNINPTLDQFMYTPGSGDEYAISWRTAPTTSKNDTGYIYSPASSNTYNDINVSDLTYYRFIKEGCKLKFVDPLNPANYKWVTVTSIVNSGVIASQGTGTFTLSSEINDQWDIVEVIPVLRTQLTTSEKDSIKTLIELEVTFGLRYDLYLNEWFTILPNNLNETDGFSLSNQGNLSGPPALDTSWLLKSIYTINTGIVFPQYNLTTRGLHFVFESAEEIRFFYDTEQTVYDIETGKSLQDEIVIMDINHGPSFSRTERWTYDSISWSTPGSGDTYPATYIILKERDSVVQTTAPVSITIDASVPGILNITGAVDGDTIDIIYETPEKLEEDVIWNISDSFIMADGYVDQRKVEIIPADEDEDNVPDNPMAFDTVVNQSVDRVFFERFTDFDEYEYYRVWNGSFVTYDGANLTGDNVDKSLSTIVEIDGELFSNVDLITVPDADAFIADLELFVLADTTDVAGTALYESTTGMFYVIGNSTIPFAYPENLLDYQVRIGRSFVSRAGELDPLSYKWRHIAPSEHRIDPSISNIQDMLIMTQTYYNDVIVWKKEQGDFIDFPAPLTTEELRIQFAELNEFKMLSDQIVFEAGRFRVLFGDQAADELQARFKIVKLSNATLSDNEIKSQVVDAIDEFFAISNWDFGEAFYYTELAAYIHQQLQKSIASVVIVPTNSTSEFGNLFQIRAEVNELFISTATVNHIDIVKSLTETNLRIK